MGIKEQLHRLASQSSQLLMGPTMSPMISMVPAMDPSRLPAGFPGLGGTTSATGLPNRVTRIGFRVLRTSSRMPRHFALNSEMAISFMTPVYTMVNDHGQYFDGHGGRRFSWRCHGRPTSAAKAAFLAPTPGGTSELVPFPVLQASGFPGSFVL